MFGTSIAAPQSQLKGKPSVVEGECFNSDVYLPFHCVLVF